VYRPLDVSRKEIRVLDVAPGHQSELIYCHLRHVALTSQPKPVYETISYVWGDATQRGVILLDDSVLDVPASSEEVIRRMRLVDRHRVVWIDAVCINQNDVQEKNQQVAMMQDVYALSSLNLVWLGSIEGAIGLKEAVRIILSDFRHCTEDFARVYDFHLYKPRTRVDLTPLAAVARSRWWTRLWIVQEASLVRILRIRERPQSFARTITDSV
jgi:hypothetical protein